MLLKNKALKVYGLEPSKKAYKVMNKNLKSYTNFFPLNYKGADIPLSLNVDLILSIGVIHHIKDPLSTLSRAYNVLKPNGKIIIWVYGIEGNRLYYYLFKSVHFITRKISHKNLLLLCKLILPFVLIYGKLCLFVKLPMSEYFKNVINKWTTKVKLMTIYDQLNPEYAKYYKEEELINELKASGFKNIKTYHRHKYSWTAIGEK